MRDELLALTKLRRNRANLEQVQEQITELREHYDNAAEAIEAAKEVFEAIDELTGTDGSGNPFTPWFDEVIEAAQVFQQALPQEDIDLDSMISDAEQMAEEYEESLDDRDYTADDREEIWGNLMNILTDIAAAME